MDESIKESNLIVFKWRGIVGCPTKIYRSDYYYHYMMAPLYILCGLYLVLKGSQNLTITLAILLVLTGQNICFFIATLIYYVDVTN